MPQKPALRLLASDIHSVTVSDDPAAGAVLRFTMNDDPHDLELHLPALAVARLQALLIEADTQQAALSTAQ